MTITSSPTTTNYYSQGFDQLRARVGGQVITPNDKSYDTARQAWNLTVDQHPAIIVVASNVDDIVETVRFAQAKNMAVAVKATGHGVIREANDSLLIVTSELTDVRVNADAQTAWVSAGTKWGRVLEETQAVGLAPVLGSSPDVVLLGLTL